MGDKSTARDTMKVRAASEYCLSCIDDLKCLTPLRCPQVICVYLPLQNANVPTVPGSAGLIHSEEDCKRVAQEVGYPLMIKATAGGPQPFNKILFIWLNLCLVRRNSSAWTTCSQHGTLMIRAMDFNEYQSTQLGFCQM